MERRVLLAIFLSFLVLYVYQRVFVPTPSAPETPAATTTAASTEPAYTPKPDATPSPAAVEPSSPPAAALVGETSERDVRVETADVIAIFTNRGARLKSWRLKRYLDDHGESLELIPSGLPGTHLLPFSLRVPDEAVTARLNSALYSLAETPPGAVLASEHTLRFEYRDTTGLHAVKEFVLQPRSYAVGFRASLTENDRPVLPEIQWGPALASAATVASSWVRKPGGLTYLAELERLVPGAIATQPAREGDFRYAGVDDHYFITVVVNPGPSTIGFEVVAIPPPAGTEQAPLELVAYAVQPAAQDAPITFFAGPKDFDVLAAVDPDLVRAIDYGYFAFLVVPLLRSLNWINGYLGNYGFSIILLTVLINAVMFPLRHKSVVSMRKMQEIQPEAKAIQERYSKLKTTDPARQKMNQELMALYKERGVNPASGCVPMLLTLPVLLAFYSLLTVSIELRGAPFFGWIHDLSHPDPYYVTPILMGATQFWQTRLTPQTGVDPAQQKMMQFMPILFMFFFLWAPAGVVLYWFVSNLWAIGQQYLTNYIIGPPNIRSVRPAAERRVKRVGAGKTDEAAGKEKDA